MITLSQGVKLINDTHIYLRSINGGVFDYHLFHSLMISNQL